MAATATNTPETKPQAPRPRPSTPLALASLAGALFVVGSVAVVFYGLPRLWAATAGAALGGVIGNTLLGLVMLAAAAALAYLGRQLAGAHPPVGLRAGIAVLLAALGAALAVAVGVGRFLDARHWLD